MSSTPEAGHARLIVASNRGPISVTEADSDDPDEIGRGGGGLVSGMLAALNGRDDVVWVCAALNDAERALAGSTPGGWVSGEQAKVDLLDGVRVRMLPIDARTFRQAYNGIANSALWYVAHMLFDTSRSPLFDSPWRSQWGAYRRYNQAFAEALDHESVEGATVMIQDYHLNLAPAQLRNRRKDLRIAHFTHTPWAPPDYFRSCPTTSAWRYSTGCSGRTCWVSTPSVGPTPFWTAVPRSFGCR